MMKCQYCQIAITKPFNCNFCSSILCSTHCTLTHFSNNHKNPLNTNTIKQSQPSKLTRLSSNPISSQSSTAIQSAHKGTFLSSISYDPDYSIENFTKVKSKDNLIILGSGTFGKVYLVKHIFNEKLYAIKHMSKDCLLQALHTLSTIYNEIDLHSRLIHDNIIRLVNVRETPKAFDLLMEAANGGSLFNLIKRHKGLSESKAIGYFIQVVHAINFLHENNIIHRDLKPENILLDEKDNVKLCDFGWSIELSSRNRSTYCGTMEYMAPEIVNRANYDKSIDIWSLGVLLYELLHGYSPFRAVSRRNDFNEVIANIKSKSYKIEKSGISAECIDLIACLLNEDPNKRIKANEIYHHPLIVKYFKGKNNLVETVKKTSNLPMKKVTRQNSIAVYDKDWVNKKLNDKSFINISTVDELGLDNKEIFKVKAMIHRQKSIQSYKVKERISNITLKNDSIKENSNCFEDLLAYVDKQSTSMSRHNKRMSVEEIFEVTNDDEIKNTSKTKQPNKIIKVFEMKKTSQENIIVPKPQTETSQEQVNIPLIIDSSSIISSHFLKHISQPSHEMTQGGLSEAIKLVNKARNKFDNSHNFPDNILKQIIFNEEDNNDAKTRDT